jgi:hypothetical protein
MADYGEAVTRLQAGFAQQACAAPRTVCEFRPAETAAIRFQDRDAVAKEPHGAIEIGSKGKHTALHYI